LERTSHGYMREDCYNGFRLAHLLISEIVHEPVLGVHSIVIRGGENLFPGEIEEFLIRHPRVADVQVVGVPDAFFGEELLAVVIPKQGEQLSERELRSYCKGQISHQKIPRYFQFVTSYPLTGSGKVQKYVLLCCEKMPSRPGISSFFSRKHQALRYNCDRSHVKSI
jgi:hypothetical protein